MTSRKRNKGKERKAKKDAARLGWWKKWIPEGACTHGCVVVPPPGHAVSRFMNSFAPKMTYGAVEIFDTASVMMSTFDKHPEVWSNAEYQQMAINIIVSVGTNMILSGVNEEDNYSMKLSSPLVSCC